MCGPELSVNSVDAFTNLLILAVLLAPGLHDVLCICCAFGNALNFLYFFCS